MQPCIGIIGVGKVGYTLARLLDQATYDIVAVYNRNNEHAFKLAQQIKTIAVSSLEEVITQADLIILSVSDDAIASIVSQISNLNFHSKAIIHTSGAISTDVLQPLQKQGAMIGSLHPAFPFADVDIAIQMLDGATFAIEANNMQLQNWLEQLVKTLNGQVILIPKGQKPLYHAALVIMSNYTVTLYSVAQQLLQSMGAENDAINNALQTLLQATADNIAHKGIPDALTGPLVRADAGTIQAHLRALDDDLLRQTYLQLAQLSLPMAQQRGIDTHTLKTILQDANETFDNS